MIFPRSRIFKLFHSFNAHSTVFDWCLCVYVFFAFFQHSTPCVLPIVRYQTTNGKIKQKQNNIQTKSTRVWERTAHNLRVFLSFFSLLQRNTKKISVFVSVLFRLVALGRFSLCVGWVLNLFHSVFFFLFGHSKMSLVSTHRHSVTRSKKIFYCCSWVCVCKSVWWAMNKTLNGKNHSFFFIGLIVGGTHTHWIRTCFHNFHRFRQFSCGALLTLTAFRLVVWLCFQISSGICWFAEHKNCFTEHKCKNWTIRSFFRFKE